MLRHNFEINRRPPSYVEVWQNTVPLGLCTFWRCFKDTGGWMLLCPSFLPVFYLCCPSNSQEEWPFLAPQHPPFGSNSKPDQLSFLHKWTPFHPSQMVQSCTASAPLGQSMWGLVGGSFPRHCSACAKSATMLTPEEHNQRQGQERQEGFVGVRLMCFYGLGLSVCVWGVEFEGLFSE